MKGNDLGVSPTEGSEVAIEGGQNSEGNAGTGEGTPTQNANQEGQNVNNQGAGTGNEGAGAGNSEGAGEGGANAEGGDGDPKDQRINNLMGKWQTEESAHVQTKSELQLYKEKFGDLPNGNQPNSINSNVSTEQNGQGQADPNLPKAVQPGWAPKDMNEFQEGLKEAMEYSASKGEENALSKIQSEKDVRNQAESQVSDFVTEIKTADPDFNEKEFFSYASKYNFPLKSIQDLRGVYTNFVDFTRATQSALKEGAENREGRKNQVNKPGANGGGEGKGVSFQKIQSAGSAQELVQDALRGNS